MTISSLAKQTGRQLVMVILAVLLTLFTYPALHSLHSIIIEPIYRLFLAEAVVPATVSVQPKLRTQGEWHISSASFSSAISESFYSSSSHSPIFDSLWYELAVPFRSIQTPIAYQLGTQRWQPAQHNYKRLLSYYSDQILFDALVQLNDKPKQQGLDAVVLALKTIPVDLFGGGYLLHDIMPEPSLVYLAADADYIVDHWSPVTEQFIRELSALEGDYWVVTPLWLLAASALLVMVPWWLPSKKASAHWLDAGLALAMVAGAVLLVVMYRWWLPVLVPLLSIVFAVLFRIHVRRLARKTSVYSNAYAAMGERWVHHLLDEAKPEMALRFLMERQPPLLQPQLWLDTGQGFERNRELAKAQHCYQSALQVDEDCTEARSRLRRLNKVVDGGKTMAIAQVRGELPVGQIADLTLGRYRLQRELGRGAMGIVYEAIDPKIDRKLALKVVHLRSLGLDEVEQVKQRFFREAQAAGKLNHPHIVTVYDVGEEHDVAYIAMDLLHGFSLAQQIQKGTTIDIVERVTWIAQAAEALAYAHDHDVIHRDVKPANMIIDERNHNLKLTDFGVARIAGVQQTQTGIVLGSPSYMSPEQIRGEPLTGQTDIFSLGVTLFQAITGVLPFTGDTLPALAYSITQSKQASPRAINEQVPVSLVRIVNRALQKSTLERYQTGQEFAQALRKWLADHNK